jgi:hypothetical protein
MPRTQSESSHVPLFLNVGRRQHMDTVCGRYTELQACVMEAHQRLPALRSCDSISPNASKREDKFPLVLLVAGTTPLSPLF